MIGDDPDPLAMTARVGFGRGFGRARGVEYCGERLSCQMRGTRKTWLVSERSTKARGLMSLEKREKRAVRLIWEKVNRDTEEAATTSGCKFYENDADAMRMMTWDEMHNKNKMQNNRQKPNHEGNIISHLRKRQELELRIWKVVSGALQHSTTTRGSRPEI